MSTLKTTNIAHPSATGTNIVLNSDDSTTLGTAKLTTLADSAGSNTSTPAEIASGRAKAWVNFDGTVAAASMIRASYNVSSITDNGAGDYTVNFTTAMTDANYACVITGSIPDSNDGALTNNIKESTAPTTTAVRFRSRNPGVGDRDALYANVAIFR